MSSINKQALREAAERAESDSWGYDRDEFNEALTPAAVMALLDELEAADAKIAKLTAERDALREGEMGDAKYSNTRAAADIYFQLVEECEIPSGGSLVEYVSELRERAAMLQGDDGNSPVIPDGLRLALSNAGIAAPESDEMLAATCEKYIQALVTWVKDRKPFRSAVIPGGWVACSERMPENGEKVLTSFRGGMRTAVCKVVDVLGHKIFVDELTLFNGVPADHWQPLPAAPQQEDL